MLSIASHYLNRDAENRGRGWQTPNLWPLNAVEWRKMETILNDLSQRRIMVFPFAGFFGRLSDFPVDPNEQELYIRYALARLGPYWNVLFNVGGPEPNLRNNEYLKPAEVNRLGTLIQQLDINHHLLSVHNPTGDDRYRDESWTSYGILQGPKTTDRQKLNRILLKNHHPTKPLFAQETLWGGNTFGHPKYTNEDIRKNAIVIIMSAAALNFGDMDGSSSSGFSGSLSLTDRHQECHDIVHRVWDFFETIPFYRMIPRQDLIDHGYCLADEGQQYLIYIENPKPITIQGIDNQYNIEWIRANNLSERISAQSINDEVRLTPPDQKSDWFLYLTKKQ